MRLGATYLAIAVIVAACGGGTSATIKWTASSTPISTAVATLDTLPATAAPRPSALPALTGWPTVTEARERLEAKGYEFSNDTTSDGQNRWKGPPPSPFELLGEDDAVAEIAISGDPLDSVGFPKYLEDGLALIPVASRVAVIDMAIVALQAIADGEANHKAEKVVDGARVEVSAFTDEIYVFLRPFGT